ncbi:hypothetical protein GGC47_001060 [Bosea sp. OAE752]|uniref:hypothetical protein n=1 Tax=Bosea sp. OAE752 TaxID=2663873 RepID=UPI003D1BD7DA
MKATKMIAKMLRQDPEAEEARLRKRHEQLTGRLADAVLAADRAAESRRVILIEADEIDEAALTKADIACRDTAGRKADLEVAVRDVAQKLLDLEGARVSAADLAERTRVAGELEAKANLIEKAAVALDKAAEDFFFARKALLEVYANVPSVDFLSAESAGERAVRCAAYLAGAVKQSEVDQALNIPQSAIGASIREMDHLRTLAAAVRDGSAPAAMPENAAAYVPIVAPDVSVVLARPIRFHGPLGTLQHVAAGGVMLPAPVAAAARQLGIGFDFESAEGNAIRRVAGRYAMGTAFKPSPKNDGTWVIDKGEVDESTGKPSRAEMWTPVPVDPSAWQAHQQRQSRAVA